jgi:hypothetical protein
MLENFHRGRGHHEFSDSNNGKILNGNRSLKPNGNASDVPTVIHDGLQRMAAESHVNLEIGTPKVDYRIVYQVKYAAARFCVQ